MFSLMKTVLLMAAASEEIYIPLSGRALFNFILVKENFDLV